MANGDAAAWLRRWDAQQQLHIPDREERFAVMVDAVEAAAGLTPRVLDLGCGPGSLSARLLDRLPHAEVVAVDADPVLLQIGRETFADRDNLLFVDADLRHDWTGAIPRGEPYDAAVSTTALHWLGLADLVRLYTRLATVLRSGGVFLDGDRLDFDATQRTIADIARDRSRPASSQEAEDWEAWWAAILADTAFADAAAERARRGHEHPHENAAHSYDFHRACLLAAGFAEVGTIWQRHANRVLIAVR